MLVRVLMLALVLPACGGAQKPEDLSKYAAPDRALLEVSHFNCNEPNGTDGELAYMKKLDSLARSQRGEIVKLTRDDVNITDDLTLPIPVDAAYTYNINIATGAGGGAKTPITEVTGLGKPDTIAEQYNDDRSSLAIGLPPDTTETTYSLRIAFEPSDAEQQFACIEYMITRFPKATAPAAPAAPAQ